MMNHVNRRPTHPGEIIREDYLKPLSISISELASILGVSRQSVSDIVNAKSSVTPRMALRLSRAFDTSVDLWLNLQKNYDIWMVQQNSDAWREVKPLPAELLHQS